MVLKEKDMHKYLQTLVSVNELLDKDVSSRWAIDIWRVLFEVGTFLKFFILYFHHSQSTANIKRKVTTKGIQTVHLNLLSSLFEGTYLSKLNEKSIETNCATKFFREMAKEAKLIWFLCPLSCSKSCPISCSSAH